ncbi:cyclin-D5-1-like [Durio zibethinus]|uniref:Cyclin-D5-1-like n=1 Tax=Durio zibethinus TaxID=66656 RepID=A0A6P5YLH5_DURZI|nr:cyclin-D5-1-like [Durio zibethinus]
MGEFDNLFSCSGLLCQETEEACFSEIEGEDDESIYLKYYKSCFVLETEDEYIEKMIQRETDVVFKTNVCFSDCPTASKSWLECARLDAIEWIFNTRTTFGFQIHTAYLSVTYFDLFLSKRSIDEGKLWAIQLLSIACLSLAAKMEECRVPALSEFPIQDYQFENKVIQRMELLVLSTLEWKMGSITPFPYLHYFISKFYGESRFKELVSKALELILAMIKETRLVDHRPSIIAAAAVLAASDGRLTRQAMELKMDFVSYWGSVENERIFACYNMMQEIEMRKSKTPKFVISSNYSSVHYNSIRAPENSSAVTTGAGTKRKLTFNESDQNSRAKKICRP